VATDEIEPVFRKVDCLSLPVRDLDAALAFYRDQLGHALIWRTESAAGVRPRPSCWCTPYPRP
jgi:catechol 2,3-dioxygenase-like lactoylglutathione lyase family enzyme